MARWLKSCVVERELLLWWNEWIFFSKSTEQAVDKCIPHSNNMFANSEGWGAEISGKRRSQCFVGAWLHWNRCSKDLFWAYVKYCLSGWERSCFPVFYKGSNRNIPCYIWVRHFEGGVAHEESPKAALSHLCRCWDSGLLQANVSSCEIEQPSGIALIYTSLARLLFLVLHATYIRSEFLQHCTPWKLPFCPR